MIKLFLALFLLSLQPKLLAQLGCEEELICRVSAKSGMRMRSEPSLQSKVVAAVPYDSVLVACQNTFGNMSYEDIHGYWRKVSYNGTVGYMFDGFLEVLKIKDPEPEVRDSISQWTLDSLMSIAPPETGKTVNPSAAIGMQFSLLTEAYNYCGDIQAIDAGLLWYGIYPSTEEIPYHRIKEVEVDIVLSKERFGEGMEFDIETDSEEKSIFLIGVNRPLPLTENTLPNVSDKLRSMKRKLFPGEELMLARLDGKPISLSATGSVLSTGDCPTMENYRLLLTGEKYHLPVEQNLLNHLQGAGKCGMPEIYWFGDLNGDSAPEIILVSVYDDRNLFTLFVSDPALDNKLVRKESEWIIDKCY